jgi:hypothetical protein
MLGETYVKVVLAMAPLVVCLAWSAEGGLSHRRRVTVAAALLFAGSVFVPPLAVWGVLPWLAVCGWRALAQLAGAFREQPRGLDGWAHLAAHLYLPVGGIWALFYQADVQPLGFAAVIVLLTGVHFHYAGFALPWLTSRLLAQRPSRIGLRVCAVGVILGVPLVAIGITSSQLSLPSWVETAAVTILAGSAFGVSHGYLAWSGDVKGGVKVCFLLGGTALALGMVLALLYGWRYSFPIDWVTIPAMYTLHGTLNSWGFCLPCIVGNSLLHRTRS